MKVYQSDFEEVYKILNIFFPRPLKETWKQLFIDHWERPEDYYGYAMVDGNNVLGFIATIFSERKINGKKYNFCNISSWVVRDEYRNQSIALIFPILKLIDYTITAFTANHEANKILKIMGFKVLTNYQKMIMPIPNIKSIIIRNCEVIYGEDVPKLLNNDELKIYNDHSKFICDHIVIHSDCGYSYVIMRKWLRKKFNIKYTIGDINYISNKKIFMMYFNSIKYYIAKKLKFSAIIINDTYLPEYHFPNSFNRPAEGILYRSSHLTPKDIDTLYSEYFILNL